MMSPAATPGRRPRKERTSPGLRLASSATASAGRPGLATAAAMSNEALAALAGAAGRRAPASAAKPMNFMRSPLLRADHEAAQAATQRDFRTVVDGCWVLVEKRDAGGPRTP